MLTDAQWVVLEPLVERCRPHAKVPPSNLRRTMSAILWRHANGAKWRSIPAELGPWWMAAQTFIRWSRLGVWDRLLGLAQERGVQLGMTFLGGTSVRAHHKAAGAGPKTALARAEVQVKRVVALVAALAKACVIADGAGRAIAFRWAPGQAHELPQALALPGVPCRVVADRGHAS